MPLSVMFYDGIFLVRVETFEELRKEIRLDQDSPNQVIVWRKGYDAPMYWSESLDSLMGIVRS